MKMELFKQNSCGALENTSGDMHMHGRPQGGGQEGALAPLLEIQKYGGPPKDILTFFFKLSEETELRAPPFSKRRIWSEGVLYSKQRNWPEGAPYSMRSNLSKGDPT